MQLPSMNILRWWDLSTKYKITLLPEYMLGRFFQLTTLSLYTSRLATTDEQQFNNIYTHLIEDGFAYLTLNDLQQLAELILDMLAIKFEADKRDLCDIYKKGVKREPQFYRAGVGDGRIFKSLQLTNFNPTQQCNISLKNDYYTVTTLSFIEAVLEKKVNVVNVSDVPMLLKALFYSYVRGSEKKEGKVYIDNVSVALAVAGALISFTGKVIINEKSYEHFIVPDGSSTSMSASALFYELVFRNTYDKLRDLIKNFADLNGVSLARAFLMAIASQITKIKDRKLDELLKENIAERYLGVRIATGDRPDILWIAPITITDFINTRIKQEIIDMLSSLASLIWKSKMEDEVLENLTKVVSTCVNSLTEYYFTNNLDALIECSRNVVILSGNEKIDGGIKRLLSKLVIRVRDLAQ